MSIGIGKGKSLCVPSGYRGIRLLFIIIMSVSGKYIHMNLILENAIDQTMLLGNLSAPPVFGFSFQGFRMSRTGLGMLHKFIQQLDSFLKLVGSLRFSLARSVSALGEK